MAVRDEMLPLDAGSLLRALNEGGVDYVVVGGLAGMARGSSYPSFDLDVAYARDTSNLQRLAVVLVALDVKLTNAPPDLPFQVDARTLESGANFTFDTSLGRFDILGSIEGIRSYEELREAATVHEIEGEPARVASIDHLIAMKRAANRPKDRIMLEEYIVIADEESKADQE
jgi:hypothetical protein